jgi:Zn-dependent M16 (insulinase) family peptidase
MKEFDAHYCFSMRWSLSLAVVFLFGAQLALCASSRTTQPGVKLSDLKRGQRIADFEVTNLYTDSGNAVVGVKFLQSGTGAPIYILQMDTVPQAFMWIDTPVDSNKGLPHALEHLLAGKGTTGRYCTLLTGMQLSNSKAATFLDFNFYSFASGSGMKGFMDQFHAWLRALYFPDFSDIEAQNEFYHFGVSLDPSTRQRSLTEQGTVYTEERAREDIWDYYYDSNKLVFGSTNPFTFDSSGAPEAMREVTPAEIRHFHQQHYKIGPGTGFIFALDPREDVAAFLQNVSHELASLPRVSSVDAKVVYKAKYPISDFEGPSLEIFYFPSEEETSPGQIEFAWKPVQTDSLQQLKLLQLLLRGLAQGPQSILYGSLVDSKKREFASQANDVSSSTFLHNSPSFPVSRIFIGGVPGTHISPAFVEQLRTHIVAKLQELSQFPDHSEKLKSFNALIQQQAASLRRDEIVWAKNPPQFGLTLETAWKDYLEYLEMNPEFRRQIGEDAVWDSVQDDLKSGRNLWRDVIEHFHLLQTPYATASVPSKNKLKEIAEQKVVRANNELKGLMKRYHTDGEQEALQKFDQTEREKAESIEQLQASVHRPPFTSHPPLTPDDDIRYTQFDINGVPITAILFDRPPTTDISLNFDLKKIPQEYYKYLPLIPRFLDSVGLRENDSATSYQKLIAAIQSRLYKFSAFYSSNYVSNREELAVRASVVNDPNQFEAALTLVGRILTVSDITPQNLSRLQDILNRQLSENDAYFRQSQDTWLPDPAFAFRYQDNQLYLALNSFFEQSHFDDRLSWRLHSQVSTEEIQHLGEFAGMILHQLSHSTRAEIRKALANKSAEGLNGELVSYWLRNLWAFPDSSLVSGLETLANEVQQDLRAGPDKTIQDLTRLRSILINRNALKVDITTDESSLQKLKPMLAKLLLGLPIQPVPEQVSDDNGSTLVWDNLRRRYPSLKPQFPVYLGFITAGEIPTGVVFTANFPGYSDLDHRSLLQVLSSKFFSGTAPESLYMKTWTAGLAYGNGVASDVPQQLLQYYADRIPDIPNLVQLVNSVVHKSGTPAPNEAVDYALSQAFDVPRAMLSFSDRGRAFAVDLRDGNTPEKVRRFSEEILKLRQDRDLAEELIKMRVQAIDPVLMSGGDTGQKAAKSIFFFLGPEEVLSKAAHQLGIDIVKIWPSDYWVQ